MSRDLDQPIVGLEVWYLEIPFLSRRDHEIGSKDGVFEANVPCLTAEDGTKGWCQVASCPVLTGATEVSFTALDRFPRPLVERRCAIAHATDVKSCVLDVATFDPDFMEQSVRARAFECIADITSACPVVSWADERVFGPEDMRWASV